MIAYILLKGKDFAIPDAISVGIIGLFFGLLTGLFYYQHYIKPWFWVITLAGGALLTAFFHWIILRGSAGDDTTSVVLAVASFIVPFLLTLALNHGLYLLKRRKRRQRSNRKRHSKLFDTLNPSDALKEKGSIISR